MVTNAARGAVVCFPFAGDAVGGSHISALKLIQHIDRERFQPLILLHDDDGPVASLFRNEDVAFELAPTAEFLNGHGGGFAVRFLLRESRVLSRFLKRRNVAIVHTNDGRMHASWALSSRLAGAKHVWHHRGDPGARGLRYLAPLVAHRVVSVSRFAAPRPGLLSAARKCTVVYSPFDTEAASIDRAAARQSMLAALGCAPSAHVLGYFGSIVRRKRPLAFVETIAALRRRAPSLELAAPLFGHDLEDLTPQVQRRACELGVGDCVRLMGFRYPPERWLAGCDVLLVPSVDEPFGRTLIEGMLLGTPVVAASSGGNPEALRHGETGFLVPPDDPDAAAELALRLLTDQRLGAAITTAARKHAVA
ncbi:MAG: glycosyltransferase, partial [Geminicoccaceae bacterium]